MSGPRHKPHWSDGAEPLDYFDLKGVVDALCASFQVQPSYTPGRHPSLHPGRTAEVRVGNHTLGVLGQLHPAVAKDLDLENGEVLVAELDFERLLEARPPRLSAMTPSRFPPADRDIAIVVDERTPHGDVEAAIRQAAQPLLESVALFDVYRGEPIAAGRKSLAYSIRYRAADRTLAEDEVAAAHGRVEETLRRTFGGEVRGR